MKATRTPPSTLASSRSGSVMRGLGPAAQVRMSGVTSRMPIASPVHHASQAVPYGIAGAPPNTVRTVTPMVALTVVLAMAPSTTRASTSRRRPSGSGDDRKPAIEVRSHAATTASRVFPTAMPAATSGAMPAVRLTTNAPSAIAGQKRLPISSSAASAIPEGGHAEETTGWTADAVNPSRPART